MNLTISYFFVKIIKSLKKKFSKKLLSLNQGNLFLIKLISFSLSNSLDFIALINRSILFILNKEIFFCDFSIIFFNKLL